MKCDCSLRTSETKIVHKMMIVHKESAIWAKGGNECLSQFAILLPIILQNWKSLKEAAKQKENFAWNFKTAVTRNQSKIQK